MFWEISANRVKALQLFVPCAGRFPKSLKWTLVQRMNSTDDSRLTIRSTHTHTHTSGNTVSCCANGSRSVSTTNFIFCWADTYQKLFFLLTTPQELYTVFYFFVFFVSSSYRQRSLCPEMGLRLKFEVIAVLKRKCQQCVLLVFTSLPTLWFILNYLSHLVAAAGFGKWLGVGATK